MKNHFYQYSHPIPAQSGIHSWFFSDIRVSPTVACFCGCSGCQETKPPGLFGRNPAARSPDAPTMCSLRRRWRKRRKTRRQPGPRSGAECDHSNLVSSPLFPTRQMRLIRSRLRSEPESDYVINSSEDCGSEAAQGKSGVKPRRPSVLPSGWPSNYKYHSRLWPPEPRTPRPDSHL